MNFLTHIGPKENKVIRNNIVAKKTTKLLLLFYEKTTKLDFLWPNMGQKSIKMVIENKESRIELGLGLAIYWNVIIYYCVFIIMLSYQRCKREKNNRYIELIIIITFFHYISMPFIKIYIPVQKIRSLKIKYCIYTIFKIYFTVVMCS